MFFAAGHDAVPVDNLKALIRRHIEGAALVSSTGVEISFRLPACPDTYASFEKLCKELDANLDKLGVSSYGLSDTTLEEVFLKVRHRSTSISDRLRVEEIESSSKTK